MDIAFQFLTLIGLAAWMPRPSTGGESWLGARFAFAGYAIVIYLFIGNVLAGISISVLTWSVTTGGTAGAIWGLAHSARRGTLRRDAANLISHPVAAFTALFLLLVTFREGLSYQPYLGDEFSSWLNLTRQIYLADNYWSGQMDYGLMNYSNGWPLLLAATSSVYSTFSEAHAIPLMLFLHLGLLGVTYDIVRGEALRLDTRSRGFARLAAWTVCLMLLAAEASYRLLATDLLIEHPMLYASTLCFLIALIGQEEGTDRLRLSLYLGTVLAAGYLFKVSMLAMTPAVGIFVLSYIWLDARERNHGIRQGTLTRGGVMFVLAFAPTAAMVAIWQFVSPGEQIKESFGNITDLKMLVSARGFELLMWMADALLDFGTAFKFPLTIVALAVLLPSFFTRRYAPVLFGYLGYFGATIGGLYLYYLYRSVALDVGYLESFQRFMLLPIRIAHYLGFLILAIGTMKTVLTRFPAFASLRAVSVTLAVLLAIGLSWQARALDRVILDVADRRFQDQVLVHLVSAYKADVLQLIEEISARGYVAPKVGVIDMKGYGVAQSIADYYSLKVRRDSYYRHFRPVFAYTDNEWSSFEILWLVTVADKSMPILLTLLDPRSCGTSPASSRIFLFRTEHGDYTCVPVRSAA